MELLPPGEGWVTPPPGEGWMTLRPEPEEPGEDPGHADREDQATPQEPEEFDEDPYHTGRGYGTYQPPPPLPKRRRRPPRWLRRAAWLAFASAALAVTAYFALRASSHMTNTYP